MKAVTILKEEHVLILKFLDQLTLAADNIIRNEEPSKEYFEHAVAFARQYADKLHHHKEEEIMFRLLAQKHGGAIDNDLERLKQQHLQCRDYISAISDAIDGYHAGKVTLARQIHRNLMDYVATLRDHITYENVTFFPQVTRMLTEKEFAVLEDEFDKWETKVGGDSLRTGQDELKAMSTMLHG
ncbi:MAG: hemerythrin domain-containing protein [candidate division Zixibacteria bacterium]|nr:hemerythrin domain-containing protein [candidate division Zixibacteria bacterium]